MQDPTKTKKGYSQDADGQWWYQGPKRPRVRCHIKVCAHCGEEYVMHPYHAKASKFCSRRCSADAKVGFAGRTGEQSHQWKGGRTMRRGYVYVYAPDHPSNERSTRKYVAEHRLVMEKKLGRILKPTEYVHHINGDKEDNRPKNLEIIGGSEHAKRHRANHFKAAGEPPHCPTCTCGK